jgi:hypothetical protein
MTVHAAQAFPDDPPHVAMVKYLETTDGRDAYTELVNAKTEAEQGR